MKKATKAQLEQWKQWNDDDEHQLIIDSILKIPAAKRDSETSSILARAYNNVSKYYIAKELLLDIPKEDQTGHLWNFRLAYAYHGLDEYETAIKYFTESLIERPGDEDTLEFIQNCKDLLATPDIDNLSIPKLEDVADELYCYTKIWGRVTHVHIDGTEVTENEFQQIIKYLKWIDKNKEKIRDAIFTGIDDDTLKLVNKHMKKCEKIDDKTCRSYNSMRVTLPVTKEDFMNSLYIRTIMFDLCGNQLPYIGLDVRTLPAYFDECLIDIEIYGDTDIDKSTITATILY